MKNSKIIAFVATTKSEAARNFYQNTLGLKFVSEDGFAIVFDLNGTMLRIQKVEKLVAAEHTVLGWEVSGIRAEVKRLRKKGVKMEKFPGLPQDESGVWVSPAGGKIAWFKDPDANILSLTEFPK